MIWNYISQFIFAFQSKGKNDVHLLSPVKESKFDADPQEKQKGDQEKKDEKLAEKGKKEREIEYDGDEEKRSMNQHSVTFAEGRTSEDGGDEGDGSSSENNEKSNQHLNEYTFSPSALQAALASGAENPSTEGSQKM